MARMENVAHRDIAVFAGRRSRRHCFDRIHAARSQYPDSIRSLPRRCRVDSLVLGRDDQPDLPSIVLKVAFAVGLTGGIGSGKTTVAGMLASQVADLVDTDAISHRLTEAAQPSTAEVARKL